jgi:hypothetical protein
MILHTSVEKERIFVKKTIKNHPFIEDPKEPPKKSTHKRLTVNGFVI